MAEQRKNRVPKELQPYLYKKGQSGNPAGRPKGSISLKEYAKRMIQNMTPEEREEYLHGLDKKVIWEMAEGKAPQTVDSNVKVTLPKPLLDNVYNNDSDEETDKTEEED